MNYPSTPILNQLIEDRIITIDCYDYVGTAFDGVEVFLGNVGNEAQVEGYLKEHPKPTDW